MTNDPRDNHLPLTEAQPDLQEPAAGVEVVSAMPDETDDDGQPNLTPAEWYMLMRLRGGTMTKNKFRNWLRKAERGGMVEKYLDCRGRPCVRLTAKGLGSHG